MCVIKSCELPLVLWGGNVLKHCIDAQRENILLLIMLGSKAVVATQCVAKSHFNYRQTSNVSLVEMFELWI